jgi:hypothetical protein
MARAFRYADVRHRPIALQSGQTTFMTVHLYQLSFPLLIREHMDVEVVLPLSERPQYERHLTVTRSI